MKQTTLTNRELIIVNMLCKANNLISEVTITNPHLTANRLYEARTNISKCCGLRASILALISGKPNWASKFCAMKRAEIDELLLEVEPTLNLREV